MALIKTDYDLSGGMTLSDEVATPNNWRVTVKITGENNNQPTTFNLEVEDANGVWAPLLDGADRGIGGLIIGNGVKSINAVGINATTGRVRIRPSADSVGICNVDSNNA